MNDQQMQDVANAATAKRIGVPGAREVYNALWDTFHTDPDFDSAVEASENEEDFVD